MKMNSRFLIPIHGWVVLVLMLMLAGPAVPARADAKKDIEKVVEILVNAFRSGDYSPLEPHLDKGIVVIPAAFIEPMVGRDTVLESYNKQQQSFRASEMMREGTRIRRAGKIAWVSYRWEYAASYEGKIYSFRGHTTLILQKKGKRWVIVHNHTSALPTSEAPPAS